MKHREIPDDETVKEVTIKKEPTGEWFACFAVDGKETPVETALPVDTSVSAKRVIEAGSPTLNERSALAVSE